MRNRLQSGWHGVLRRVLFAIAVALAGCGLCRAEQVIDDIIATVNRHAILESELEEALGFECLVNSRPLRDFTSDDRHQTLQRLIDQELIAEEMRSSSFVPATAAEISERIRELRKTVPTWKTDEGWHAALAGCGLTKEDVEERIALQVNLLRYLDLRFRPEVRIDRRAIENYYREQLLPQLRRAGTPEPPLNQVAPMIEQLLVEQRINQLQSQWVRTLRSQAEVQVR